MLRTVVAVLVGSYALYLTYPWLFGRQIKGWEAMLAAAALGIVFRSWHVRQQRRERQDLEGLRDSALW
jgi:hypothetical protein